jgi:hypothetical protein
MSGAEDSNITAHPTVDWVCRQLSEAFRSDTRWV